MSQNNQQPPRQRTATEMKALQNPPGIPSKDFDYKAVDYSKLPMPEVVRKNVYPPPPSPDSLVAGKVPPPPPRGSLGSRNQPPPPVSAGYGGRSQDVRPPVQGTMSPYDTNYGAAHPTYPHAPGPYDPHAPRPSYLQPSAPSYPHPSTTSYPYPSGQSQPNRGWDTTPWGQNEDKSLKYIGPRYRLPTGDLDFEAVSRRMLAERGFARTPDDCRQRWEFWRGPPLKQAPNWEDEEKVKLKELVEKQEEWETIASKVSDVKKRFRTDEACQKYYNKWLR